MGRDHFDTSYIVTGGSKPHCSVRQDSSSCIIVAGSAKHYRDPRIHAETPIDELLRLLRFDPQPAPENAAWCSHCGEWRLKSYFSPDASRKNGLARYCKQCRNEMKRKLYREQQGREVRGYQYQTA